MRRTLVSALALLTLAVMAQAVPRATAAEGTSKEGQPFVTVVFAGYNELVQDVRLIAKLGGTEDLVGMLEQQLQAVVGEEALKAIDKSKPWGVTVKSEGGGVQVQGFLPITNVKALTSALEKVNLSAEEAGEGLWQVNAPPGSVFVKQLPGGWAAVAQNKNDLAKIAVPEQLLTELSKKYLLAVNLAVKNVPDALRDQLLGFLQFGMQMGMQPMKGESQDAFAARKKAAEQAVEQLTKMAKELDSLLVGLSVDDKTTTAFLDYVVTALPGTDSAKKMAQAADLKSNFAGLIQSNATSSLQFTGKIEQVEVAQAKTSLASVRSNVMGELEKQGLAEEDAKKAKLLVGELMDVLEKTLESGTVDGAASFSLEPKKSLLVAGGHVAEGAKLEAAAKQLVELVAKDEPDLAKAVKLNAEEHGGVKFHVFSAPAAQLGDAAEGLSQIFGEKVTLILGTSADSVYLAAGSDPASALKQAIDQAKSKAGMSVPPARFVVSATPVARFVASVAKADAKEKVGEVVKILESVPGKDQIQVNVTVIPNGAQTQLLLQEGILKTLGSLPKLAK